MLTARIWLFVFAGIGILASFAQAEAKKIEPVQSWKGSVADRALLGQPATVVASAAQWKAQWKAWKLDGEAPEVDFAKHFVVIQTTVGSQLRPILRLDGQGDLKVASIATRDLRPGFRYVMAVVAREGVKTVNGAALPAETEEGKNAEDDTHIPVIAGDSPTSNVKAPVIQVR